LRKRVVVTGTGIITACGTGPDENWAAMSAGKSGIREIQSFDPSKYRGKCGAEVRGFTFPDVEKLKKVRLDRASLLLIHAVRQALVQAGVDGSIQNEDVLVSLGTTLGGMLSGEAFHREVIQRGLERARVSLTSDYLAHYQPVNVMREFNLRGDTVSFSNACASGTNAIGYGYRCIRSGEYGVAVCGGYDTMSEFTFAGFNALMAVSPTLCRPFDRKRDGLVLGEGAGIVVLEEMHHALDRGADILAEVAGYGESADAYHLTSPDPSGRLASKAMNNALEDAGCPEIDYINAHGTGTELNDVMEARAIRLSFGDRAGSIPVSSIKPMVGHILGGAGAVEAIVSILVIRHKVLPPNLHYETPDHECDLHIVRESTGRDVKTVLSNSFGFGGANASLILGEYV
jgi:3-oxoacyl-[acyl-carrier-protein] synthase II